MSTCRHGVDSNEAVCGNCERTKRRKNSLRIRRFVAPYINFLVPLFNLPSWGGCQSCGMSSHIIPSHSVQYNEMWGSSIICEACWRDLNMSEKLKIFRKRWEEVYKDERPDVVPSWQAMKKAIEYPFYWENESGYSLRITEVE